jgi:hypothetical protein
MPRDPREVVEQHEWEAASAFSKRGGRDFGGRHGDSALHCAGHA